MAYAEDEPEEEPRNRLWFPGVTGWTNKDLKKNPHLLTQAGPIWPRCPAFATASCMASERGL